MKKKILLSVPIFCFFGLGYLFKGYLLKMDEDMETRHTVQNFIQDKSVNETRKKKISAGPIKKRNNSTQEISTQLNRESFRQLMKNGGQKFFYKFFDKNFWTHLTDRKIDQLLSLYGELKQDETNTDSHQNVIQTSITKIGFLKSLGDNFLKPDLDQIFLKRMIDFHKEIINTESHLFVKRQAAINLHKIINFIDESQRERHLASIDKRVLYLSTLTIEDILNRLQNSEKTL